MSTFLLIRHADNDFVGHTLVGWQPCVHLNERGREQAARLAVRLAALPIAAIYSSPLERALETAEPLARRLALPLQLLEQIGEVRTGNWTGRTLRDLEADPLWKRFNEQRSSTRIPGGETMLELQARMLDALTGLRLRYPEQTLALFSHGDPLRAVLCHFLGVPLDFLPRLEVHPASVSVLEWQAWGARVLRVNDTGELP